MGNGGIGKVVNSTLGLVGLGGDVQTPSVVTTDPQAEADAAADAAAKTANAKAAARKKRGGLLATGADGVTSQDNATMTQTYGKSTLGS